MNCFCCPIISICVCCANPCKSFYIILNYPVCIIIANSQIMLCSGIALLSGFSIPFNCFLYIFFNSVFAVVTNGKIILRFGIALLSSLFIPFDSLL